MAGNDVEWTSQQMIENANSWSLAGDVALLNRLKKFSESLLSETVSVSANVDNLLNSLESVSLKLDLTKNEFQSLRNTQFIENRVYEDDETLEKSENKKEEKELTEEEKENVIKESIMTGLKVMEKYFEKIEVAVSDSEEEENEKSYILQAKDPYADRPLPYLVGSQEWYKKWHVGLLPSESESESEKEEEVFSSSDSEEGLPKDKNLGSETCSELDFTNRNTGPVANSTFNDSQDRRREIFHSSDESSEQSNSLPVKAPISNEKFAEQLAAKLGDVISNTAENSEHVNRNPIKKMNQPTKYGNLFSDEPPPLDDLDDTVLPKSAQEGLFSGGRDLFADSTEEDLFWDQPDKTSQNIKKPEEKAALFNPPDDKPNLKVSKGLFDKSDSSSEDDMFTVAEKRKVKVAQPYLQPLKSTIPFVDDKPPEITTKSDSVPSKKKPIGGVSIFGENANIFGENSRKPGFESTKTPITQDTESKSTRTVKKPLKKTSLFDESSDEDVATPKNDNTGANTSENQQTVKKLSLFGDIDDIVPSKTQNTLKKPEEKKKLSLFDDGEDFSAAEQEDVKQSKQLKKLGLFDEDPYENIDVFRPSTKEIADKTESLNKTSVESKTVKKISLFDDDDDFLEEEDIFASEPKQKGLFDDFDTQTEKASSKGLFEETVSSDTLSKALPDKETSSTKPSKNKFEDNLEKDAGNQLSEEKYKVKPIKTLFDDFETSGDSEDFFGTPQNQNITQEDGQDAKKVSESLFVDIERSTSPTSLPEETKKEEIDAKSLNISGDVLEVSSNTLDDNEREEKAMRDSKDLGVAGKERNILEDSDIEGKSQKGMHENDKAIKQKGAGLFEDTGNDDFLEGGNKDDIEEKSGKLDKSSAVQVKNTEDLFGVGLEPKYKDDLVEKANQDGENHLESVKNEEAIDDVRNLNQDGANNTNEDKAGQTESVLKQSTNDLLGKIRKNVGFLDSDGESSSDEKKSAEDDGKDSKGNSLFKDEERDIFGLERQDVGSGAGLSKAMFEDPESFLNSSISATETSNTNAQKNYTVPPIDLFDPTPPPPDLDWDAGSDNSGESDTFSLTDGILSRTNFSQSQARSSLFDEAPPSLDVNESSGIVRDLNVTRVETDDSSFYPYASSSRRLSSDIFGEQQSQDSLFVTKNRTETSGQAGGSLDKIPENIENVSSKIENITPSGNLEDFEGSSVFERSGNESKDPENMNYTAPVSEIKRSQGVSPVQDDTQDNRSGGFVDPEKMNYTAPVQEIKKPQGVSPVQDDTQDNRGGDVTASNRLDNVKKRASLFEETPNKEKDEDKSRISPTKTSPRKLQHNLQINVSALMPGAPRPKLRSIVARSPGSDETDKSASSSPPGGGASLSPPLVSPRAPLKTATTDDLGKDSEKLESLSKTEVLQSATKDRVRIPVKRRPSTRRARQEAVRKSVTDFSLYQNEESSEVVSEQASENDKMSRSNDKNSFLKDLNDTFEKLDDVPKKESSGNDGRVGSKDMSDVKGISLVFGKENEENSSKIDEILEKPASKGFFDSLSEETEGDKLGTSGTLKEDGNAKVGASNTLDTWKSDSAASNSLKRSEEEEPSPKSRSIFEESSADMADLFKNTLNAREKSRKPKKPSTLFRDVGSDGSDEDLFSSTTKSFRKDDVLIDKPTKVEIPSKKEPKSSIFSDKSDSEGEGDIFSGKPKVSAAKAGKKIVGETSKKASIFDDSDDSSEEDLFGSKTSKSGTASADVSESTGSVLGTRRAESKNVKIAGLKKLENKQITDFDPLSAFK